MPAEQTGGAPANLEGIRTGGRLDATTLLAPRCMVALVQALGVGPEAPVHGVLLTGDEEIRYRATRLGRWPSADTDQELIAIFPDADGITLPTAGALVVELPDGPIALPPTDSALQMMPLDEFASAHLAPLDAALRAQLTEELIGAARDAGVLPEAAAGLATLRDILRTHHAVAEIHPAADFAAQIDGIWRVDERSFYVEGWVFDRRNRLEWLRLVSPEGRTVEILDGLSRYRRPDVSEFLGVAATSQPGFITFVQLPEPSPLANGWLLQGISVDGHGFEAFAPAVTDNPEHVRGTILADLQLEQSSDSDLLMQQIGPAISCLQERLGKMIEIDWADQHGDPPANPEVSIVVPLYRRTEFLEHQLAQFVLDSEFQNIDLIYVLDSPEDAAQLRPFAQHLHQLYGVAFRLAGTTSNGGYSVVNNLGATLARGRMLLLLNSDVLPDRPGWLSPMVAAYDANPKIGALSPKLVYEDDSIQHAGLYFDRPSGAEAWSNEHFYKGLHRSFPAANVARAVPAVTGACLMIDTELFRSLGGLRGIYVRGDYEDSDLCLRLRAQGLESWYLPEVELYHLEGQSYPSAERQAASHFNRLLHSDVWRDVLGGLEGDL